jgi:peptidyl-prolyl cis-trans isomerase B (cyclophilin B)
MKKILCLILAILMLTLCAVSCNDTTSTDAPSDHGNEQPEQNTPPHIAPKADQIDMSTLETLDGVEICEEQTDYVLIDIADYGKILIRLYPDVAPETVANFKKLVSQKFYDGLIFHRVIRNFMIQGGDPDGNGTGGSSETIRGEFAENGFENNLAHVRGVVAMARSNNMNSASSQFYICHKTSGVTQLDGKYASFGFVVYGMDVVDKIAKVNTNINDKPLKNVVMTSVRFAKVG